MTLLWVLSTIFVALSCMKDANPNLNKLISVTKRKFLLLALLVYPFIVFVVSFLNSQVPDGNVVEYLNELGFSSSNIEASSDINKESRTSRKGSYSSCASKCDSDRSRCESMGSSFQTCKGGEKLCLKDCCVMYQSSDPMAAAWCR